MRKVVVSGLASAMSLLGAAVGFATTGAASSIVTVAPPERTPSILTAGEAAPAPIEATPVAGTQDDGTEILAIGNSLVAIGADAIPPSREEVAAIGGTAPAETGTAALPGWLADDGAPALRGGLDEER